ncbi:MAG: cofactor assembly of complex C subunit B [Pseudanabaenaceae cyanobacterium]
MRYLPLAVGVLVGIALAINRLTAPLVTPAQARADAAGVLASAVLVLIFLLWQEIQPRPPAAVTLTGAERFELAADLPETVRLELAWASRLLLTNTVTKSLVLWYDGRTLLLRGILPVPPVPVTLGPIAQRARQTGKPVYLVKLDLYPGRLEFAYLPPNTQGVIVQPVGDRGVLILGTNVPRSYTRQDERWIEAIADKLAHTLTSVTEITTEPDPRL